MIRGLYIKNADPTVKPRRILIANENTSFTNITNIKHYNKYVKSYQIKEEEIVSSKERTEIIKRIFTQIETSLVENTGGVVIEGFGYFSFYRRPVKKTYRGRLQKKMKAVGGHRYQPIFTPMVDDTGMKYTSMDYTFKEDISKAPYEKLLAGHKYFSHRYSFKQYLTLSPKLLAYRRLIRKNRR